MKSFFVIALVALLALSASVAAQEVDLSTSLEGVWAVELTQTSAGVKFATPVEAPIHLVANFSRREGQLVAAIASSDGSVSALVQLTTEGIRPGSFYLLGGSSSDDEFDAGAALMAFDLKNNTGRTLIGSGEWLGVSGASESALLSKPGFYQLTITDYSIFVLNVVSADGQQLITITGSKTAAVDDQPWWAKFGTPLLFVGAMSLSRLLRSWFGGEKKEQAPAGGAGAAGAAAKAKKD